MLCKGHCAPILTSRISSTSSMFLVALTRAWRMARLELTVSSSTLACHPCRLTGQIGDLVCSMMVHLTCAWTLRATLTAEDILNSWPELEVGRILRDYGEESNWQSLQRRIVKERKTGGLHSTGELVKLIQRTCTISGGRQGWIKTATRVFQALRIAVNDELQTLEDALHSCFDCLAPDGRLAVISFHSLEDRIVKQTFLELISGDEADDDDEDLACADIDNEDEPWFKQRVQGTNGTVLTKRPITPSQEEEKLNQRCRSAKLRVIQKA
uniref:Ribosomal RNA small subunit methyltransferase H n=1 Tax=Aegilops tauschii subsp. strangulata TaxID=200361 RepID=A0A453N8W3_AEGTS